MEKNADYKRLTELKSPKSSIVKHTLLAFIGGGTICLIGEALSFLYIYMGMSEENAYTAVTVSFIFLGSALTALGIFDNLSGLIFAGTLVPVTGFSNSITSAAMDAVGEGRISGVGAKIFTVAGPVILFASISGFLYSIIYFISKILV